MMNRLMIIGGILALCLVMCIEPIRPATMITDQPDQRAYHLPVPVKVGYRFVCKPDSPKILAEFVSCIYLMTREENYDIIIDRELMMMYHDAVAVGAEPDAASVAWYNDLIKRYGTADTKELMLRVAPIPEDIAVAQAIGESGWGKSYSYRVHNSIFGHQNAVYQDTRASVHDYVMNLNTHRAYGKLRQMRADGASAFDMVDGLEEYSINRQAYIRFIRMLMPPFTK
jgi:uncharacterized FlgJ-related protein